MERPSPAEFPWHTQKTRTQESAGFWGFWSYYNEGNHYSAHLCNSLRWVGYYRSSYRCTSHSGNWPSSNIVYHRPIYLYLFCFILVYLFLPLSRLSCSLPVCLTSLPTLPFFERRLIAYHSLYTFTYIHLLIYIYINTFIIYIIYIYINMFSFSTLVLCAMHRG